MLAKWRQQQLLVYEIEFFNWQCSLILIPKPRVSRPLGNDTNDIATVDHKQGEQHLFRMT